MFILQGFVMPKSFSPLRVSFSGPMSPFLRNRSSTLKSPSYVAVSRKSDSNPDPESGSVPRSKQETRRIKQKTELSEGKNESPDTERIFPTTTPRKPRRGRESEAAAVEDFVRDRLERTFASIRQQNSEVLENKDNVLRERVVEDVDLETSDDENYDDDDEEEEEEEAEGDVGRRRKKKKMVVEEDDPNWPLDADVGWGIRASEYFEQHPIKNVVGDDGFEIDWEGELDDSWVKEINCLEWESFAFHPSPLMVLVFERYNRATDNWKTLKELEKAIKVYWSAKDRLPPRAVKIDINIERDLAYALKVKDCPQILFLLGNVVMYREKEFRTADELVQMIAHFYYKAKRPSWINKDAICRY
ncbi:thioredoxin-like fold domain-containing protein MRL7, chloroplastic [Mangifera indica]|uniref:thioredoxin-like fold domain-containing protein MRL7, chloroplastic n=1 Tax=Mangifera indica TaxID=29780 RepID=UPI001CFA98F8|nr:thioredoxin-like fold domain-containing protein MRL7, chloroplastic [Mangifera indica]XP_044494270.1 thioredoxin-like fold domain-containing protein MRL7, chloroplastic [Mangifera indica]